MEKLDTTAYWQMVFGLAWQRTRRKDNMKWVVRGLLLGSVVVMLLGCALFFRLVPEQVVGDAVFRNNITGLAIVLVGCFGLVVDFIVAIKDIPPYIHNEEIDQFDEQVKQLTALEEKWECAPVVAGLGIKEFEYATPQRIGVSIHNPSNQKITNLIVELVTLTWVAPSRLELTNSTKAFHFSEGEFDEQNSILPCKTVKIYLAALNQIHEITFVPKQGILLY